ncbi:MAG: hypothetical protein IJR17_04100 [Clostridia bacterium]|nr:hypothetical protein [Clostridia bacterium]
MTKVAYRKKKLSPLFAEADKERVAPILDALRAKGFEIADESEMPTKSGVMLLFTSERLNEAITLMETFFANDAKGVETVPINLDGSTPPELLKNALYSRNTIFAERYSVEELAQRIATAKPFEATKKPLPIILAAAAAALVIAGGIFLATKLLPAKETMLQKSTPAPTAEPVIPSEAGLTAEDLNKVYELIIVGDTLHYFTGDEGIAEQNGWARIGAEYFANRTKEDGIARWYSNEDGHEIELSAWNDLDFLRYMKNVKFITLVRVIGELPDLSGLLNLGVLELFDCSITDLSGVTGSQMSCFQYRGNTIADFSPLNGCGRLNDVHLEFLSPMPQDLSSFAPPALTSLHLWGDWSDTALNLDGLKQCSKLKYFTIEGSANRDLSFLSESSALETVEFSLPQLTSLHGLENKLHLERLFVGYQSEDLSDMSALSDNTSLHYVDLHNEALNDLSWLSNAKNLEEIELWYTRGVRSLKGLENHTSLRRVHIEGLDHLSDISALESCTGILQVHLNSVFNLADISPIVKLPRLHDLAIYGSGLHDVDFLSEIVNKNTFSFGISEVDDWSGLAALPRYSYLNITDRNGSALPYIHNTPVAEFEYWNRDGLTNLNDGEVDLMQLPEVGRSLTLHCVRSLETLRALDIQELTLDDCPLLTSLNGLEHLPELSTLRVQNCSRLVDWSAIEQKTFDNLELVQLFTLPDFSALHADRLRLESIFDLTDLSALASFQKENYYIELFDLDGVTDLSPLYAHKGRYLKVPAHLQTQAELLVESKLLDNFEVEYPDGWWESAEPHVELLSFDELDTLPSAVLSRVRDLHAVGDVIFSWEEYWLDQQWDGDKPTFVLRSNDGDPSHDIAIEHPGTMTDFSKLSKLTGLEHLNLIDQSLTSIEGIQNLQKLKKLELTFTPTLMDASPVFTLQDLEELKLQYTGVTSIQGIQNLQKLQWADLNGLKLDDLAPLGAIPAECNLSFDFPLMTVDEFVALPDDVLSRVREIGFFGNYVMKDPWGDLWLEEDWDGGDKPDLYIHDNATGERFPIGEGQITDFGFLTRLPNLESLYLYGQPVESLGGIETAAKLRRFQANWANLSDLSPLFDLKSLEIINVADTETVTSIEGVEKLLHLTDLNISRNNLSDISAIAKIDYTFCMTPDEDGNVPYFVLSIDNLQGKIPDEQYAVLSAVPEYQSLNVFNTDCALWMDAVKQAKIHELHAGNCRFTNETFKTFIEQHPELEYIKVSWTSELTDISPLLTLRHLRAACVSNNMQQAIRSLGGEYGFELEIE